MKTVYEWNLPNYYPVPAQVAGEAIEDLRRQLGKENISAEDLLEASRPADVPLHSCFEWDDTAAAEKYRLRQAGDIIRHVTVKIIDDGEKPQNVRAFVHVGKPTEKGKFVSFKAAMEISDYRSQVLSNALFELRNFQRKYAIYSELAEVFKAIDGFAERLDREGKEWNKD